MSGTSTHYCTPCSRLFDTVARPVIDVGRRFRARALRIGDPLDLALLETIARGELATTGFRNRDIRARVFPGSTDRKRLSAKVSRLLRLLRAHGLIKKVQKTHRYHADERPVRPPQSALVTSLLRPAEEGTVLLKASAVASYVQREGEAQVGVTGDRFVFGRGPQCDLVIDSPRVSREHAALLRMGVTYLIEDLGSSNGTWFNEQPVSRHHQSYLGPHCYRT